LSRTAEYEFFATDPMLLSRRRQFKRIENLSIEDFAGSSSAADG
jgi:hypothetical protein